MGKLIRYVYVAAFVLSVSCGIRAADDHGHEHAKPGPNGGELQEAGDKDGHQIEAKHDHKNGKTTIWILAKDLKTAVAIKDAPKINLKAKDGNKQIEMKAVNEKDGAASQWEASDEGFKQDPLDGRISIKLADGNKYSVKLDAHHDH
jgi:hypothetical protein